jgi:hypothetical protein
MLERSIEWKWNKRWYLFMGKRLGKFEGELVVGKNLEILIGFSQGR